MTSDICINRLVIILVYFYINLYIFFKTERFHCTFNIALELLGSLLRSVVDSTHKMNHFNQINNNNRIHF